VPFLTYKEWKPSRCSILKIIAVKAIADVLFNAFAGSTLFIAHCSAKIGLRLRVEIVKQGIQQTKKASLNLRKDADSQKIG
jgi:hypothetical protein